MKAIGVIIVLTAVLCSGCAMSPANQSAPNKVKINQAQPKPARDGTMQQQKQFSRTTPDLQGGPEKRVRAPHPMTLSDLRAKYSSTFLLNGSPAKREIALTFDDAPDDHFTPQILDVLKKEGVKATFFVVGNRVRAHPEIVQRMVREGHVIGNHSWNHANLPKLSDADFRDQIRRTDEAIRSLAGYRPTFVRPPYGNISENQIGWLASEHKVIVNWDIDSLDWKGLDAEQVKTNVLAHTHPGAIVLQHSAGGTGEDLSGTVQALPDIISKLRSDGIKLVTVPELLDLRQGR